MNEKFPYLGISRRIFNWFSSTPWRRITVYGLPLIMEFFLLNLSSHCWRLLPLLYIISVPLSYFWKTVVPPRVKAFSWISFMGRQNTMEVIKKKSHSWVFPLPCALCVKGMMSLVITSLFIVITLPKFKTSSKMSYLSILSCLGQWKISFTNGGEGCMVIGGRCFFN